MSAEELVLSVKRSADWETWLRKHHDTVRAVLLIIGKKGAPKTITYAEALDGALAWGWIDSQKRPLDEKAFLQRFSPRTAKSPWSKINCAKVEALIAAGKMQPSGLAEVDRAKKDGRWDRAYSGSRTAEVPAELAAALSKNAKARAFFESLDSANRFAILYRVQSAVKAETRSARIEKFVSMCARHETIHPVTRKVGERAGGSRG